MVVSPPVLTTFSAATPRSPLVNPEAPTGTPEFRHREMLAPASDIRGDNLVGTETGGMNSSEKDKVEGPKAQVSLNASAQCTVLTAAIPL